ncbi:DNA-binding protein [Clostridia bacterium]|nr:DNA-binding protein [Clostridia bacterium]
MNNTNEIVLYQLDAAVHLEVMIGDDTVWLTQQQMMELFQTSKQNISLHINNIFKEGELISKSVVKDSLTTAADGKAYQTKYYNLDVIISVGYRVKSQRGTQFRIWATNVLREYLLKGYAVNQRIERLEHRVENVEEKVDFFVRTVLPPVEGIFHEGQIFDAYEFVSKLVKSAKKQILLIDNYVDETVLGLLAKRKKTVSAVIYTSQIGKALQTDIGKHNEQYGPVSVERISGVHDRFLIIDESVYHIGASIKDLGKKLFAFSKLNISAKNIVDGLTFFGELPTTACITSDKEEMTDSTGIKNASNVGDAKW